ncbi:mucoidy inhibitor MuiA family protein, partial [Pyxidicoccus sp. 3LG]
MLVVSSTLDAVTVHAQGALCTRVATVLAEGGRLPPQVRINGLPLSLRPGSLRASVVQGPAGLSIRDIRSTFDVQLPPEVDVPAEHRAMEEARARLDAVSSSLDVVNRELRAMMKLAPTFPPRKKDEFQPRDAPLPAMLSLTSLVDSELAALQARRLDLERQQRDAEAELRLRHQRIQESSTAMRGQRARVYRAAVLTLAGNLPAEHAAKLALEYAVPGARWVPTYDLRLPRTLEEGTLRMRASVLQRTGEDWTGVKLSVSTADLDRRAEVPELKALRIGRRQPAPARSGWREPPPGLDELFAGYD